MDNLIYKEENIALFNEHLDFMDKLLTNYIPQINEDSIYYAVLFELRPLKSIVPIIKNHMFFLNNSSSKIKWGLQVFHGTENEDFLKNELKEINNIVYQNLGIKNVKDRTEASNIMKTLDFWESVRGEKILMFQTDSMLLKSGIEEFIDYDYIGAPWAKPKDGVYVGNGGLSLRTKKKLIDVIKNNPNDKENLEDIYFSIHLQNQNLAPIHVAKKFSVEDVYYNDPLGIHKPHKIESRLLKELFINNKIKFTL